jgi:hypothetical protein
MRRAQPRSQCSGRRVLHDRLAWWTVGFLLGIGAVPPPAAGGGLRDLQDAWLVGAPALMDMLGLPVARSAWQVSLGHGQLYGMPELPQSALQVQRRHAATTASVAWQQLGRDLYREQQWRLELAHGSSWQGGARVGLHTLALPGGPARSQTEVDLVVRGPVAGSFLLEAWLPLGPAPEWYGQHGLRRWLLISGKDEAWAWAVAIDRAVDGTPSLQAEVMLAMAPGAALGIRLEPATGSAGLSTAWRAGSLLLRTSHALHPELGPTHRWSLVVERGR